MKLYAGLRFGSGFDILLEVRGAEVIMMSSCLGFMRLQNRLWKWNFIEPSCAYMDNYAMIIVPALYAAANADLQRMKQYVENGGYLIATFKTAYTDENVKVYHDVFPHVLSECLGRDIQPVCFSPMKWDSGGKRVSRQNNCMELLKPRGAEVLASYDRFP